MDGVEQYFQRGEFKDLEDLLNEFLKGTTVTTKIDGAPAIVMWSSFPGLNGPGVSFKTIIKQTQAGTPKNVYLTNDDVDTIAMKAEEGYTPRIHHRIDSFKDALNLIAPNIKPGVMLWGDALFSETTKDDDGEYVSCTPNTLTYRFNSRYFPKIKQSKFGICIHTAIDSSFKTSNVSDPKRYLTRNISPEAFILTLNEIKPELKNTDKFKSELRQLMSELNPIQQYVTPALAKDIRRAEKNGSDMFEEIRKDRACRMIDDTQIASVVDGYVKLKDLKERIIDSCRADKVQAFSGNEASSGEGYVVMKNGKALKLVSDEKFTKLNVQHIRSMKNKKINEAVEGDVVRMWTSSKRTDLMTHFTSRQLTFGNSGGSQYGFALYCVLEQPFTDGSDVGYSKEVRAKLYGENVFEFEIPVDKVLFFIFSEYKKTPQGRNSKFETYIREQLERFGVQLTDEELNQIQPENDTVDTASIAFKFYKLCTRKYFQRRNGTLDAPFSGFVYRGKLDGRTYVGWKPYDLIPVRYTFDGGQTWKNIDKSSKEYKAFLKGEDPNSSSKELDELFDGNRTKEKEQVYRFIMEYNSNDGTDSTTGKDFGMSEGVFYNIVIHDDKTIDASYKFNRPITDNFVHYYRPRSNIFLDKIFKLGYRFGNLDCGLKIGSESDPAIFNLDTVPAQYLPKTFTGGLKLLSQTISKPIKLPCKVKHDLVLEKCQIDVDVFSGWNVTLSDNPKKLTWTINPEVKTQLASKYDWADSELLLPEKPAAPVKKKRVKKAANESQKPFMTFLEFLLTE